MLDEILMHYQEELKKHPDPKDQAFIEIYKEHAAKDALKKIFDSRDLSKNPALMLQIMQEFNQRPDPSADEARIIACMDISFNYEPIFTKTRELDEIMQAYKKSARILTENNNTGARKTLSSTIHNFMRAHPETAEKALEIYDQYLFDTGSNIIDHIRGCIARQPKLLKKGFETINRVVDSYQEERRIAQEKGEKMPYDHPAYFLPVLFGTLYEVLERKPQDHGYFDIVTDNLIKLAPHFEVISQWETEKPLDTRIYCLGTRFPEALYDDESCPKNWSSYQIKRAILCGAIADAYAQNKPISEVYYPRLAKRKEQLKEIEKAEKRAIIEAERQKHRAEKKAQDEEKYAEIRAQSAQRHAQANLSSAQRFIYIGEKRPTSDSFEPIQNFKPNPRNPFAFASKPNGGLWASPVMENGRSDWENWLEETEPFNDAPNKEVYALETKGSKRYYLIPKSDCRILTADNPDSCRPYIQPGNHYQEPTVDFESMAQTYDAFILPYRVGDYRNPFRAWSCETLLVFNLDKFEIMDEQEYAKYEEQNKDKIEQSIRNGEDILPMKKPGDKEHNHQIMLLRKKVTEK